MVDHTVKNTIGRIGDYVAFEGVWGLKSPVTPKNLVRTEFELTELCGWSVLTLRVTPTFTQGLQSKWRYG